MISNALVSADQRYRYWLTREWDAAKWKVCFIGLNPSTADHAHNDPTIIKCIGFAQRWGFGGLLMLNLCAWRATEPRDMWAAHRECKDIIGGEENSLASLSAYIERTTAGRIVAAWGKLPPKSSAQSRAIAVRDFWPKLECIKRNQDGSPAHPLFLPSYLTLSPWNYVEDKIEQS